MRFWIHVNTTNADRKFKLLVDASKDLSPALKQFGKYLRNRTAERFKNEGPGWPKLADSTRERLEHTRTARITTQGTIRKSALKVLEHRIRKDIRKGTASRAARAELNVLSKRDARTQKIALRLLGQGTIGKTAKAVANLERDVERHGSKSDKQKRGGKRQSDKHKLLGRLAATIRSRVSKHQLIVESIVPWAGVHNDGGAAGRGSQIPKREFLKLEEGDVRVLAQLLEAQLVEPFTDKHGS